MLRPQLLHVHRKRDDAGHAVARRRVEAQLRLHVEFAAADVVGKGDDGHARVHQVHQPRQQLRADIAVLAKAVFNTRLGARYCGRR